MNNNGIQVERYNFSQDPKEFMSNPAIREVIENNGAYDFPVAMIDDAIVDKGRYLSNDEFKSYTGVAITEEKKQYGVPNIIIRRSGGSCCCG